MYFNGLKDILRCNKAGSLRRYECRWKHFSILPCWVSEVICCRLKRSQIYRWLTICDHVCAYEFFSNVVLFLRLDSFSRYWLWVDDGWFTLARSCFAKTLGQQNFVVHIRKHYLFFADDHNWTCRMLWPVWLYVIYRRDSCIVWKGQRLLCLPIHLDAKPYIVLFSISIWLETRWGRASASTLSVLPH